MKPLVIKDWGKGLNKDQPPFELAPGFWSDALNMRFRTGKAERMGGIASVLTPSVVPYWMLGYSSGATRDVAYAGTARVYVHDGTTETQITRGIAPVAVTSIAGTGVTATVTTTVPHGLATSDVVQIYGVTAAPALNTASAVITVTSASTFTYANGTASAAVSGSYAVINSASAAVFTGAVDDKISGGNLNGVLIYNNPVDGLFYWDQSVTGRLRTFPATTYVSDFARPFKNYIFQGAPTISGTKYRHQIGWSAAAAPGSVPTSFIASDTNDAGETDLPSDGECVDALQWGEDLIIYKRDVRFRARFIGGNYVFDFQLISGNSKDDGLLAIGCAANTPKGQVFITDGLDIRIHAGGQSQSICYGRMLNTFRAAIDPTYRKRAFVEANPYTKEVWICFPESGQTTCTSAYVWNWEDDTWAIRALSGVTCSAAGELPTTIATSPRMLVGNNTPKIGLVDSGTTDFGVTYTSMLERTGMDFDSDSFKMITASMPRFDASISFTASVYHGASLTQDGTPTYAGAQTYTHNTTQRVMALSGSGQFMAWKMTTTAADTPSLRSIGFWITGQGDF